METLEERINFSATIVGLDLGGSAWQQDFFSGDEPWLTIKENDSEDHSVGFKGVDKLRMRFSEPVVVGEDLDAAIAIISQDDWVTETFGENFQLADDGLSAVWNLPTSIDEQVLAIRTRDDAFGDANDGSSVDRLFYGLDVLPGDASGDGAVQFEDFLLLSSNFGVVGPEINEDFAPNGAVEFADFLLLSSNFGKNLGPGQIVDFPVTNGQIANRRLELGDVHVYEFEATASERLFLSFSESVGTGQFNPQLVLYAPDGSSLVNTEPTSNGAAISNFELSQNGKYSVVLKDSGLDFAGDTH